MEESSVQESDMSHMSYHKQIRGENHNTTLLLRCEDRDFTHSTHHCLLRLE